MINRKFFFDTVRTRLFGKLNQSQVDGLTEILDEWEQGFLKVGVNRLYWQLMDDRFLAYMLATAYHETDKKMQPIEEYGKGKGHEYGQVNTITGKKYYGRGLVQLTWDYNYKKLGEVLKIDLYNNPELALQTDISIKIMFVGMTKGYFTGKRLGDYFNPSKEDWVNARKIINGLDKAKLISDYALRFYSALSYTV